MSILWTDDLATGVTEIDNQHKEIFKRIGALLDACRQGKGRKALADVIDFLGNYVIQHFEAEERLQREHAYPDYPSHKMMHDRFLRDFADLKKQFDQEGGTITTVLATNQIVVDWLANHIKKVDKSLATYIKSHG